MPNVLDLVDKEHVQHRSPALAPTLRQSFWQRLNAYLTTFCLGLQHPSPQRRSLIVDADRPALQSVDRLAREFPLLYIQASCM